MLKANNVSFAYGSRNILENINFEVRPGEITVIIGPNGVGKSTLIKALGGMLKVNGDITLQDKSLKKYSRKDAAKLISYLSQDHAIKAALNVFEVVLLGKLHSLSYKINDEDIQEVMAALKQFNLEKFATRNISQLSGGQRQLVFIAQALIREPSILLLDEPTSSLDLHRQFEMLELLKRLTVSENLTTVMTLHHLDMAARYADNIIVLNEGTLYGSGAPEAIFTKKMLREVYKVDAKIVKDEDSMMHILPTGPWSGE